MSGNEQKSPFVRDDDDRNNSIIDPFLLVPDISEDANGNGSTNNNKHRPHPNISSRIAEAWMSSSAVAITAAVGPSPTRNNPPNIYDGSVAEESFQDEFILHSTTPRTANTRPVRDISMNMNHHHPFDHIRKDMFSAPINPTCSSNRLLSIDNKDNKDNGNDDDDEDERRKQQQYPCYTTEKEIISSKEERPDDLLLASNNTNYSFPLQHRMDTPCSNNNEIDNDLNGTTHHRNTGTSHNNTNNHHRSNFESNLEEDNTYGDENDLAEENDFPHSFRAATTTPEPPLFPLPRTAYIPHEIVLDEDQRGNIVDENLTAGDDWEDTPRRKPPTIRTEDRQRTPQSLQVAMMRPSVVLRTISGQSSKRTPRSEKYYHSYYTTNPSPQPPVPAFVVVHSSGSAVVKVTAKATLRTSNHFLSKESKNDTADPVDHAVSTRRRCDPREVSRAWCKRWGRPVTIAIASAIFALALVTVVTSLLLERRRQQQLLRPPSRPRPPSMAPTLIPSDLKPQDGDLVLGADHPSSTSNDIQLVEQHQLPSHNKTTVQNATALGPIWEGVVKRPYEEEEPAGVQRVPTPPPRTMAPTIPTFAPTLLPTLFPEFASPTITPVVVPWNNYVIGLLSIESPSTFTELDDPTSPQFLALQWISMEQGDSSNVFSMDASLQRYALATIYFATGGGEWTSADSWLSNTVHECDWSRVTCDNSRTAVISLELTNNALKGRLPPELKLLKYLRILRLNDNSIKGSLPPEYSRLGDLEEFHLANNQLTGSIPWEYGGFGSFAALRIFDVSRNLLEGRLPSEMGEMSNLQTVNLCSNVLTGTIPSSLGSLEALESLQLGGNPLLTGNLPRTVCNLQQLNRNNIGVDCSIDCECCSECCSGTECC